MMNRSWNLCNSRYISSNSNVQLHDCIHYNPNFILLISSMKFRLTASLHILKNFKKEFDHIINLPIFIIFRFWTVKVSFVLTFHIKRRLLLGTVKDVVIGQNPLLPVWTGRVILTDTGFTQGAGPRAGVGTTGVAVIPLSFPHVTPDGSAVVGRAISFPARMIWVNVHYLYLKEETNNNKRSCEERVQVNIYSYSIEIHAWKLILELAHLFAASSTDHSAVRYPGPEQILLPEKTREPVLPFVAQSPGEDFVFIVLFILLHVIR